MKIGAKGTKTSGTEGVLSGQIEFFLIAITNITKRIEQRAQLTQN